MSKFKLYFNAYKDLFAFKMTWYYNDQRENIKINQEEQTQQAKHETSFPDQNILALTNSEVLENQSINYQRKRYYKKRSTNCSGSKRRSERLMKILEDKVTCLDVNAKAIDKNENQGQDNVEMLINSIENHSEASGSKGERKHVCKQCRKQFTTKGN